MRHPQVKHQFKSTASMVVWDGAGDGYDEGEGMICRGRASEEGGEEERILIRRQLGARTSSRTLPLPKSMGDPRER